MGTKRGDGFFASKGFLLLVVLIAFILILSFFFGDSGFIDIRSKRKEIKTRLAELELLKEKRDQLAEEVKALESDPLALERTARERLWLMKKNEKVIVIIDAEKQKIDNEKEKNRKKDKGEEK